MNTFAILLGGDLTPTRRLQNQIAEARFVAANGGIAHAAVLGAQVELWVGDFDSTPSHLHDRHGHVEQQSHPIAKDATDGELAVETALARGASRIVMVGGLGGASDHAVSHLAQLLGLARRGISCFASSGKEEACPLLPGKIEFDAPAGTRLSIVGFSDLEAISLGGVGWPLDRRNVPLGSSLTMSNVVTGKVSIVLEGGYGVVFLTFDDDAG